MALEVIKPELGLAVPKRELKPGACPSPNKDLIEPPVGSGAAALEWELDWDEPKSEPEPLCAASKEPLCSAKEVLPKILVVWKEPQLELALAVPKMEFEPVPLPSPNKEELIMESRPAELELEIG